MKIFLAFFQGNPAHPISAYSFWPYYIKNGIEEAGFEWMEHPEVDWAYGIVPQSSESFSGWKTNVWQKTVEFMTLNRPDIFISYLYPGQVDDNAIREIQKLGIPCVNFYCDNVRQFNKAPKEFEVFDLNWVPEYKALELYKKSGFKFMHLPMPMWVAPEHRTLADKESYGVSFIGSKDIQRQLFFEEFVDIDPKFQFDVYGAGWLNEEIKKPQTFKRYNLADKIRFQLKFINEEGLRAYTRKINQRNLNPAISETLFSHIKGKPSFGDYVDITKNSSITLGINRYSSYKFPLNKPDKYSRLRDIEAPMLGCCYLTEETPDIHSLYEIGKEIETYQTADECVSKCKELLKNPKHRALLRLAAQKKALHHHSIPETMNRIKAYFFNGKQ